MHGAVGAGDTGQSGIGDVASGTRVVPSGYGWRKKRHHGRGKREHCDRWAQTWRRARHATDKKPQRRGFFR